MADEQQRGAVGQNLLDAGHRLGLELRIADRQRLVNDQHVGLDVHLHRERQPQHHARAVSAYRLVDVIADLGKARSEEHTSELQSLMRISYAVFCLQNNTSQSYKSQY